jgi:thiamine biosynthesis protein ThiC
MDETNFDQEQAHYHFVLGEIVHYISQYGVDQVMTDIYNHIEMEKISYSKQKNKELCLEDE